MIRRRYGIGVERAKTLQEIAVLLGLSRERVRQIQSAALKKIMADPETSELRAFR